MLLLREKAFCGLILGTIVLNASVVVYAETDDDWSMFQNDYQHSGYSDGAAPNSSEIRFIVNYTTAHNTYSSPIVAGGRLIIAGGGYNYSIYSINATSGEFLWRSSINFFTDATPAAFENRVVVPSSDGYLYCFDITDGTLIWKFRFSEGGYGNLPAPIIHNGLVFHAEGTTQFGKEGGHIYALSLFEMENATTPRLVWKKFLNSSVTSSPAYSNGKILLGYTTRSDPRAHYVVSLNATDGRLIWSYLIGTEFYPIRSSPTVVGGRVYFGSNGYVYSLSESSGELLWKTQLSNTDIYASPAVANDKLYVGTLSRKNGIVTVPAVFYALNVSNGEVVWDYQLDKLGASESASPASSPAVADGKVFVGAGHQIYAFNETNGEIVWSYETIGISGGCSPAVALEAVYICDQEGHVYSFGIPEFYRLIIISEHGNTEGEGFYRVGANATISVTSPVIIEKDVRYVFTNWTGDYKSELTTANITMNVSKMIIANWKKQYYLTVNSSFGNPQGEGWYDANSTATFSVSSPDGFIIRHWFKHWVDDSTSASKNSTIYMDGPKKVTAIWESDYFQLFFILGITGLAGLLFALILRRKRARIYRQKA